MKYIDTHCHIDLFDEKEIDKIVEDVDIIYAVSMSYESSLKVLNISEKYSNVKASLGIHPEYFEFYKDFPSVKELIINNREKIFGIGEVGLPYFSLTDENLENKTKLYNQGLILLENFIILAKELSLPIILHATQTTAIDAYNLLKKHKITNALFHWLNCDSNTAKQIFDSNYFVSASIDILYDKEYLKFVENIPLKNLLIESDSPWKYDDNNSSPKDIKKISSLLSKIHHLDESNFLEILYKNLDIFLKV